MGRELKKTVSFSIQTIYLMNNYGHVSVKRFVSLQTIHVYPFRSFLTFTKHLILLLIKMMILSTQSIILGIFNNIFNVSSRFVCILRIISFPLYLYFTDDIQDKMNNMLETSISCGLSWFLRRTHKWLNQCRLLDKYTLKKQ